MVNRPVRKLGAFMDKGAEMAKVLSNAGEKFENATENLNKGINVNAKASVGVDDGTLIAAILIAFFLLK